MYDLQIIMANPLPNHVVNFPDEEQVQPELEHALLGYTPARLDIPNNNNWWIEEEPKEDPKIEEVGEEEKEEMEIKDKINDPKIINPYEIEEGTTYVGSGSSRKVFAPSPIGKDVDILHRKVKSLAQQMFQRANTEYSTLKRLNEMDRYLGGISMERRSETREHHELKQSVSTISMPPKAMSQAAIERLITQRVNAALEVERPSQANTRGQGSNANQIGGQDKAPPVCECTFLSFMKYNPTLFHGKEGAIELCRWFEKSEMVFGIMATLGLEFANEKSWADMKKMMLEEFCPDEKVQRMDDELRSLKLRDTNIATYTQRFNELVLLCPEAVPTEKKKVEAYIKGLPENIKWEVTSS
nr:hypothetical protein [Tanacetum cinerariifolium]